MKLSHILSAAYITIAIVACQTPPQKYTIVQYNVGAFSKYDSSSVEHIARAVKEMAADAVTLNEVDSCTTRTGEVDQMAAFAQEMGGWNQQYAAAMPYKGGAYGVGVASQSSLEIIRTDRIALPKFDGSEPRAVAVVEYKDFILCSTHLDHTRESQVAQIEVFNHYMDSVYADCTKPVFFGGDFNAFPDSESIALMKKTWKLLTPETSSFPSHAPDRCIDYIFVRPNGKKITVNTAEIPTSLQTADLATATDHLPVVLTVTIQ